MQSKSVKLLFYCTKAKPNLMDFNNDRKHFNTNYGGYVLNGKVVAEAECVKVENVNRYLIGDFYRTNSLTEEKLYKKTCLNYGKLLNYVGDETGYASYLKNVKTFEEPKELNEYYQHISIKDYEEKFNCEVDLKDEKLNKDKYSESSYIRVPIKKAPQNMMYCYDKEGNLYVLISIRPEWLCKILNGEKTIEVRKSILNSLKELIENV